MSEKHNPDFSLQWLINSGGTEELERQAKFEKLIEVFDLLNDTEELDAFLASLPEDQRDKLYSHPIHKYVEGLLP